MIYSGNDPIVEVYLGEDEISEIWKGSDLIFRRFPKKLFKDPEDEDFCSVGDILWHDREENDKVVCRSENARFVDRTRYVPIGIVAIPMSHNVYGDGSAGIMSLVWMSPSTPNEGALVDTGNGLYLGRMYGGVTGIPTYRGIAYVGIGTEVGDSVQGVSINRYPKAIFPTDKTDPRFNVDNPHDPKTRWAIGHTDEPPPLAPSPYLEGEVRNPMYYQTSSPSTPDNALSIFNGKEISESWLKYQDDVQPDWKSSPTIIKDANGAPGPAACWRFKTEGTEQGDWYLPTIAELGYIMARIRKINRSIISLRMNLPYLIGGGGEEEEFGVGFWISCIISADQAGYQLQWTFGETGSVFRNGIGSVRSFYKWSGPIK